MNQQGESQPKNSALLAFMLTQLGVADSESMRTAYQDWQKTNEAEFSDYVSERGLANEDTVKAALTIINARSKEDSRRFVDSATEWVESKVSNAVSETIEHEVAVREENVAENNRFLVIREHRQGGLGEVFIAKDRQFNRDVALKRIKPEFAENAELKGRFLIEAELTGALEQCNGFSSKDTGAQRCAEL